MKLESKRASWIDYAKGFAITMVVYRHVLHGYSNNGFEVHAYYEIVQNFMYNIRMPLFFMISGFFIRKSISNRNIFGFILHKSKTIIYPYFVWGILQVTLKIITSNEPLTDYLYLLWNPFGLHDQLWFLWTLFLASVVFAGTTQSLNLNSAQNLVIAVLLCLCSLLVEIHPIKMIMQYYVFLALGDLLFSRVFNNLESVGKWRILLSLVPGFIIGQLYWLNHPSLKEEHLWLFNIIAINGAMFIFILSILLSKNNFLGFLSYIGKHSVYIYLMHVIVQAVVRVALVQIIKIEQIEVLLAISMFCAMAVPIAFYQLCKYFNFLILFEPLKIEINKSKKISEN